MASAARLWAPWRHQFLAQPVKRGCIFCTAIRSRDDRRHHVIARQRHVIALLNRYPYNNGHLMIAPRRHIGELLSVTPAEWGGMLSLGQRLIARLQRELHPHGFNVGLNLGRVAGAGIPGHLHLHVVPRWQGDTNFMPILAETKVISQSLEALYELFTRRRG